MNLRLRARFKSLQPIAFIAHIGSVVNKLLVFLNITEQRKKLIEDFADYLSQNGPNLVLDL